MKKLLFRWAIGDVNTSTRQLYSNDGFSSFLRMAKTSILSFQRHFPRARFFVFYNGDNYDYFSESFNRASPALIKDVTILDIDQFGNPYHFNPKDSSVRVWYKWVPFRYDKTATEIHVDTDIICINKPDTLIDHMKQFDITVMSDRMAYFCEEVCGDMWQTPILKGRIPINSGLLALKPKVSFEDEYLEAAKKVLYTGDGHSVFLDEQGCINIGLYQSDKTFALLQRDVNIYGHEFKHRILSGGQVVETCHFIGYTKSLFNQIEPMIYRRIMDENYTVSDFYADVICNRDERVSRFAGFLQEPGPSWNQPQPQLMPPQASGHTSTAHNSYGSSLGSADSAIPF